VRSFFTQHNCRSQELIEQRLEAIRRAVPAVRDRALIEAAVAMTKVLVELIATLREGIAGFDRRIAQAVAAHPDFAIFDSFPGAGPALAPRLLAAFGSQRDRYLSAADVLTFSGIAPVTERSGKSEWVHVRWACPRFLRQTFHEWADHSIGFCDWARAYYGQQRDAERITTPPFGPSRSSGSESPSVAGRMASSTTTLVISRASAAVPRR
jgi:transposase